MFMRINRSKQNENSLENKEDTKRNKIPRKQKKKENTFKFTRGSRGFQVRKEDLETKLLRKCRKSKRKSKLSYWKFEKARRIFLDWMAENIHRFNVKPIVQADGNYLFEGVSKNVQLCVNTFPEAMLSYHHDDTYYGDSCYDLHTIEYIGDESYNPQKGFYDADRTNGVYKYFKTREELYINEVFEVMLEFCNEVIIPDNSLYIIDFNGATSGFIDSKKEASFKYRIAGYIDDKVLTTDNLEELFREYKAYKIIKYDLFKSNEKPLIRYERKES